MILFSKTWNAMEWFYHNNIIINKVYQSTRIFSHLQEERVNRKATLV